MPISATIQIIVAFILVSITPLAGQLKRHLYIANDDHTDYIWTADAETYRQAFIHQMDYYIGLMESQNDTLPSHYQHRYNCDNILWAYEYEKAKSPEDFQRLISLIKSGHISVPFNPLVPVYGAQNAEIAIRGMYYGGYLERQYGIDIDLAVMMENQTMPLGIASLWAGAGAKYSWKGVCSCASPYLDYHDRKHEVYYARGLDGNGVLMKWYDLITNQHLGGYAECRYPNQAINDMREKCNTAKYPFDVAGAFGFGWDDLENYLDFFPDRARSNSDSDQQVFVSNEIDFFKDFQSRYEEFIPGQSVSYGNDWDLLVATMAQVSGDVKRATSRLRSAEAMASLVVLKDTAFLQDLSEERELAWISLGKYYDHDWTADGPVSSGRAQFQREMASNFISYVDTLYNRSKQALGQMIQTSGDENTYYVFNPLGWIRTDIADLRYDGPLPVTAVDVVTGGDVPTQVIHKEGLQYVRILASDLPSAGYKCYKLEARMPMNVEPAATYSDHHFESERYNLTVTENGTISSLVEKGAGNTEWCSDLAMNTLGTGDPGDGTIVMAEPAGPVSATIRITSTSPVPHETEITLFRDLPRIDIQDRLTSNPGNSTQTISFPVNVANPTVWHEEIGAVINASLESHGGHYADQNARYDWQTANHFVHVGNENHGMTISSLGPHFFKLGNSTIESLDEGSAAIHFLATGKVAYGTIGINQQDGDEQFDYAFALYPHDSAFHQTQAMVQAMEHQTPFITGLVSGGSDYPPDVFSLLRVDDPDVLLWALKPAEQGSAVGLVARVWNQGEQTPFTITCAFPIYHAAHCSHVETPLTILEPNDIELKSTILQQELKTFSLRLIDTPMISHVFMPDAPGDQMLLFPNPAKNYINVKTEKIPPGVYTLTIFNADGIICQKKTITITDTSPHLELDISKLNPAVFVLNLSNDKATYRGTFVKLSD